MVCGITVQQVKPRNPSSSIPQNGPFPRGWSAIGDGVPFQWFMVRTISGWRRPNTPQRSSNLNQPQGFRCYIGHRENKYIFWNDYDQARWTAQPDASLHSVCYHKCDPPNDWRRPIIVASATNADRVLLRLSHASRRQMLKGFPHRGMKGPSLRLHFGSKETLHQSTALGRFTFDVPKVVNRIPCLRALLQGFGVPSQSRPCSLLWKDEKSQKKTQWAIWDCCCFQI